MPVQTNLEGSPRKNRDHRITVAYNLLYGPNRVIPPKSNTIVYKATRSGGTSAFVAEMLNECGYNKPEMFCVVEPTERAARESVMKTSIKYADTQNDPDNILYIPGNHECIINKQMCKEYPTLERLPMLPLGDSCISQGIECEHFRKCPVTAILCNNLYTGVCITYHKLAALVAAVELCMDSVKNVNNAPPVPVQILEALTMPNMIFDEAHKLECADAKSITIADVSMDTIIHVPERLRHVVSDSGILADVLETYIKILRSDEVATRINAIVDEHRTTETIKAFRSHNTYDFPNNFFRAPMGRDKFFISAYKEIIRLAKRAWIEKSDMDEVLEVYTILCIVMSPRIYVTNVQISGRETIALAAVDNMKNLMVGKYIRDLSKKHSCRIIFMSSTFGSKDYAKLVGNRYPLRKVLFGHEGDPMDTNSKMMIIADDNKGRIPDDLRIREDETKLIAKIRTLIRKYEKNSDPSKPHNNTVMIVAKSMRMANWISKELSKSGAYHCVDYYNSTNTISVASNARIGIFVGLAEKPHNAYDIYRDNKIDSMRLRKEQVDADTWQAMSRVKDPNGSFPSVVFALNCGLQSCVDASTWGYDRHVEVVPRDKKFEYTVHCDHCISSPIIKLRTDLDAMISLADEHIKTNMDKVNKHLAKVAATMKPKPKAPRIHEELFKSLRRNEMKFTSKLDVLKLFVARWDAYYRQMDDGTYSKYDDFITDKLLERHLSGEITLGVTAINPNHPEIPNMCQWICIDIDAHIANSEMETIRKVRNEQAEKAVADYHSDVYTNEELHDRMLEIEEIRKQKTLDLLTKRQADAEVYRERMRSFLLDYEIPYLLEASGSKSSYHFWIFLKYCEAWQARAFGKDLIKLAGIPANTELNPKQDSIKSCNGRGYGNQVKLPLGYHRKKNTWSMIEVNGKFVRDFEEITIGAIDVTDYKSPFQRVKDTHTYNTGFESHGVRPIFPFGLDLQLTGSDGHHFRMAAVREYANNGMKDVDALVNLFKGQADFEDSKTRYHVENILMQDFGCWKKETIENHCGEIVAKFKASGGKW